MTDELDAEAKARLLLRDITEALQRGTKHYDKAGNLLTTPLSILRTLECEGGVMFEPSETR